ncbi:hypothetical protein MNB_SUP05-SYMBIONT-5-134 [hydrothermal vent metagenome]|uniref:Uncharacterized protein n=1 Tax=hydrothermal vent metagenome TaxID=652676 RepID=A0A1W1E4A3_9ZZZZ
MDLKNSKINKICHFANHPYLCKGLNKCIFTLVSTPSTETRKNNKPLYLNQ